MSGKFIRHNYNIDKIKAAIIVYIVGKSEEDNWYPAKSFQRYVPFDILSYEIEILEMLNWNIYKHTCILDT